MVVLSHLMIQRSGPLGVLGAWGVSVSSLIPYVRPGHSVALKVHSGGFVPPEQVLHSGGVVALRRLDFPSPYHSLETPLTMFHHSRGFGPPLCLSHYGGITGCFLSLSSAPLPFSVLRPMEAPLSSSICVLNFGLRGGAVASRFTH